MAPGELEQRPPNPARAVQSFVGEVVSFVAKPLDMLNHGVAEWTRGVPKALGSYPAARNGDVGFAAWRGGYIPIFEVLTGSSMVFIGGARAIQNSLEVAKLMLQAELKDAGRRTIFSGATPLRW